MKIVLDSNILFSALIKDSITRKIILEYDDKNLKKLTTIRVLNTCEIVKILYGESQHEK